MPARGVFQGNLSNTGSRVLEMLTSSKAITASHALEAEKLTVGNVGANGIPVYFQNGLPVTDSSAKAVINWVTANSNSIGGSTGSEAATAAAVQGIMQASGSWNSSSAWVGANSASLLSRTSSLSITASLGAPTAVSISYSPNGGNKAINIKVPSNPGHIGAASASHNHTIAQVTGLGAVTDSVKRLESSSSTYVTTASFNSYTSSADGKYLPITGGTLNGNLEVSGDLTVKGTTVSIDATNLNVKDKLILVASGSTTRAAADGAGMAVATASAGEGGAARIQYENAGNRFTSSVNFAAPGFTGSLQGNVKGTASYALEADYAVSSSQAQEANHAVSSSEALHAASATSASYASSSTSASYASNAGSALTASYLINGASIEVTNAKTASYVAWNNVANKPNYSASFVAGAFATKSFNPYSGNQTINIPTQPGHVGAAPASHTHSITQVTGLSAISTSVADMSSHTSSWNNVANTASAAYTAASQALATASVAQGYAESASTYAANASASMQNARTYATNANTALTQANAASSSAKNAATAANTASGSAKNAATAANTASGSAKTAATAAQGWESSASLYASQAQTYRNAASASASVAHTAKTQAEASASAASQSAATAATYATAASASSGVVYQKAQEASASAAAAAGSAATAGSARDAANTASGSAKTSANTATSAATAANNASASAKSAQTAANNASASAMAYATSASASAALLYKATGSATQPVYISADGPTPATAYSAASVKEAVTASNVAVAAVNTNANLPVLIAAAATPANPTPVKYDTNLTYNASTNRMNVQQVSATGLTGSLRGNVVGNVTGTASWATSASEAVHAITSSYALVAASVMDGAGLTVESASYATSASYASNSTTSSFALDHYKPTTATGSAIGTTAARTYIKAINVDKNNHVISVTTGSETVTNTDTKVTAVGNHYTPAQSTGKAASAGSVISGLGLDAKGHVVAITGSNSITSASFATNAAQLGGKAANQYASASHTHGYATPAQVTGSLGAYLPLAGGTVTGDLIVQGNAIFNGTASFINTTDLVVKDRLILLASGSANTASANGAGIAVQTASAATVADAEGAAARIQYLSAGNKFTSSVRFEAPQIGATGITASLLGTASRAISASFATNASQLGGKAANQYASASHTHGYSTPAQVTASINALVTASGSAWAANTDTKVTAVGNHYTPAQSAGKAVSAGQVMTGIGVDAAGHVVSVTGSSAITASCLGVAANTSASVAAAIAAKWTYNENTIKGVKVTSASRADSAASATSASHVPFATFVQTNGVYLTASVGNTTKITAINSASRAVSAASADVATLAKSGSLLVASANADRPVLFTEGSGTANGNGDFLVNSNITFNPNTKVLKTPNISSTTVTASTGFRGNLTGTASYATVAGQVGGEVNSEQVTWGGPNQVGTYKPIDAALVSNLSANRFAFMQHLSASFYHSTNSGTSWNLINLTESQKSDFFNGNGFSVRANQTQATSSANPNAQLMVSVKTAGHIYTVINKFLIYLSTQGDASCWCTVRGRLQSNLESNTDTWEYFVTSQSVSGWSGWNVINTSITTYGNTKNTQYGEIQFIFGHSGSSSTTYSGLQVTGIQAFGGMGWTTPSTLARTGHLYSWDGYQNATFPKAVTASNGFKGNLIGNVTGTSSYATTAGSVTGISAASITASTTAAINALVTASGSVWATDNDTKVTAVGNHYAPTASTEIAASITGSAGAFATNTEYTVLTGIKAKVDAKGHITDIKYTAQKVKDTTIANTDRYVATASFASTGSAGANGVKMTLTRRGSDTGTVVATIPVASTTAAGVVTGAQVGKIESGSTAFGWGNHANAGYLKSTGTIATASYNAAGATALAWITSNSASALKNDATTYAGHYTPSASGATAKGSSAARTYLKTVSVDGKGHVVGFTTGSETVTNTDTKVTAVGNHYTPAQSAGKSVSAGQVMVGVGVDAAGHVVAVTGSSAITASCLGVAANTSASVAAAINAKWTYNENTIKGVKVNNATAADSATSATKLVGTSGSLGIPVYVNSGVPTACNANIVSLPLSSSGATTGTLTLVPGKVHKCGTLTGNLTLALGTDNTYTHEAIYCCKFNMGATLRTITLPSGVKVMENSVALDTINRDYEINIMDNIAIIARTEE